MRRVLIAVDRLQREEDGQDLVEYALLIGLIALVAIVGVGAMGNAVSGTLWQTVMQGIAQAL
jgi:Flp pilus assembly pilin Flp